MIGLLLQRVFGEFSVIYRSRLPISEAVGRLARLTATFNALHRQDSAKNSVLDGFVTRYDVSLSQRKGWMFDPFVPIFEGRFEEVDGAAVLKGRYGVSGILKIWILMAFLLLPLAGYSQVLSSGIRGWGSAIWALTIVGVVCLLTRLAIRPTSRYVRFLETTIIVAIDGEVEPSK